MNMQIQIAIKVASEAEAMRAGADVGHRSLCRLLHYVAEFAGQGEFAFAVDYRGFGAQDGAADFGPGQAGDQSDFALLIGQGIAELDDAQEIVDVLGGDRDAVTLAFFYDAAGDFAADVADFAFQVADAGFASVGADQPGYRVVGETDIFVGQARGQSLLFDQELFCDLN